MRTGRPGWTAGSGAFSARQHAHARIPPPGELHERGADAFECVGPFREVKPLAEAGVDDERGKLRAQRVVVRAIRRHEHAAPGLVTGAEAEHESPVEVGGFRAEHRAQHEARLALERLPQPGVAVDFCDALAQRLHFAVASNSAVSPGLRHWGLWSASMIVTGQPRARARSAEDQKSSSSGFLPGSTVRT